MPIRGDRGKPLRWCHAGSAAAAGILPGSPARRALPAPRRAPGRRIHAAKVQDRARRRPAGGSSGGRAVCGRFRSGAARRARQRRVADLRGRPRQHEILAPRSDRPRQLRRPGDRVALAVRGRRAQPDDAGRLRVARRLAVDLRRAEPPRSRALARRPAAHHHELQGHPADGRRPALHQHADVGRGRHRRADGRDAVGPQPEELRGRHDDDVRPLEPTRRGVLVERPGPERRADLLRHRQRLSRLRRREERPALRRLRGRRPAGPDGGHPARGARRARLAERAALLRPVSAHRVRGHGGDADVDLQLQHPPGDAARLDARLRRAQRPHALDVPHDPAGRRVRQRDLGRRFLARDRQGGRVDDDEHRSRAAATSTCR